MRGHSEEKITKSFLRGVPGLFAVAVMFVTISGLILIFALPALNEADAALESNILTIEMEGEGNISPSPGTYPHSPEKERTITIERKPTRGWKFLRWEGDIEDPQAREVSVTMSDDRYVKAVFEERATRENPAEVGEEIGKEVRDHHLFGGVKYELTLEEVIRGEEAWNIIDEETLFRPEPDPGEEYILTRFSFKLLDKDLPPFVEEASIALEPFFFEAVSEEGSVYEQSGRAVELEREKLGAEVKMGEEHSGWVYFKIAEGDEPDIVFMRDAGFGESWFSVDL